MQGIIPTPTVHPGFTGAAAAVAPIITARALTPSATDLASYSACNVRLLPLTRAAQPCVCTDVGVSRTTLR